MSRNIGFAVAVSRRALFCGRMRALLQSSRTKPHFASSMRLGACVRMMGKSCDGRGVVGWRPVVRGLCDVELCAEAFFDGALVYGERVAAAHIY